MERENMVKSVSRALDIIQLVSDRRDGLGVTEIANQMDINKSSVHRILSTLSAYGYIEQDQQTGRYKLGYAFLAVSSKLLDSIDLRAVSKPYLTELEAETNEVIHLVVYDRGEVVYIEKLDGNEALRMHSKVGKRAPMHCTSVGKAILAHIGEEEVQDILNRKGLPKHTEHTITDQDAFMEELAKVKSEGYALDLQENEYGIICIAAPIFDHQGNVCAAISISGPSMRMTDERMLGLKTKILETGRLISARVGYANN
ncbi:MAG: IclR family transcriptional regulator [Bacillus sp. (in: firmicutes)]